VAYAVHIVDADRAYLDGLPLTARAQAKVADFIDYGIAQVEDHYRKDPAGAPTGGGRALPTLLGAGPSGAACFGRGTCLSPAPTDRI
jgi:hypothetical protein